MRPTTRDVTVGFLLVATVVAAAYSCWLLLRAGTVPTLVLGISVPVFIAIAWSQAAALREHRATVVAILGVTFTASVLFAMFAELAVRGGG